MASQFAPEALEIIDLGTAKRVFVDGLAHYQEKNGLIRSLFYILQPDLHGMDADPFKPTRQLAVLELELQYTSVGQEQMRRKLSEHLTRTEHPFKVELAMMRS